MEQFIYGTLLGLIAIAAVVTAILNSRVARTVGQIHILVNSRMTSVLNRVDQLTAALDRADIDVPPDPDPQD